MPIPEARNQSALLAVAAHAAVSAAVVGLLSLAPGCGLLWGVSLQGSDGGSGSGRDAGAGARDGSVRRDAGMVDATDLCNFGGLVACYPFENELLDYSGLENHATPAEGTTIFYESGQAGGRSLSCSASSWAKIAYTEAFGGRAFAIDFWIQPNSVTSDRAGVVVFHWPARVQIQLAADRSLLVASDDGEVLSAPPLTLGVWTHIALSAEGSDVTLYIDGRAAGSTSFMNLTPSGDTLSVGGPSSGTGANLTGRLDSLRIWGRALTAAEVCVAAVRADCPSVAPAP